MVRSEIRFACCGLVMGLVVALVPACAKKCDVSSCATGCCSSSGECQPGTQLSACGVAAAACQTCNGGACTAGVCTNGTLNRDGGVTPRADAGSVTPLCKVDFDCASLRNGSVCDTTTGACVTGRGCNQVSDCQSSNDKDPCYSSGVQCLCDKRDAPDTTTAGTCRRRRAACEPCSSDFDCGDNPVIYGPPEGLGYGKCRAMTGDTSGAKFCLYQRVGSCKCGTGADPEGLCRPSNNSCSEVGCRNDSNCPSATVCTVKLPDNSSMCGGVCKPRCRWDFDNKGLAMPGCAPGQTCWVDSENLDAGSRYYGSGRCQTPCTDSTECKLTASNPWGGPALICKAETLANGMADAKRCRPDGQCMDSFECPDLPTDKPELGYCDKASRTCKGNCRVGDDPLTGAPYRDCRSPYSCAIEGGVAQCKLQNCVQQGGAAIACLSGHYCCGEDKDGDGVADPCPPKAQQDEAGCYEAPKPPFCVACSDNNSCKNLGAPSYQVCANGSKSPSCSLLPNLCVDVGKKVCGIATWNDDTRVGGRVKYQAGCPSSFQAVFFRHDFAQDGENTCTSDTDCNKGTTAGKCENDPQLRLADGGTGRSCMCTAGSGKTQCPNDTAAGVATECRVASSGRTFCIESAVCLPPNRLISAPPGAPDFGCGL